VTAMPSVVELMVPTLSKQPFSNPKWLFEPKWDGYRALCYFGGSIRFISRRKNDFTKRFPEPQAIQVKAESAIIDGEITAIDDHGLPCFDELRKTKRSCAIIFYAFDLLALNGKDFHELPLLKRKAALKRILRNSKNNRIRFTDYVIGEGLALFAQLEERSIEGMVAKRIDSKYVGGSTRDWLKIKTAAGKQEMRKRIDAW
jgi:bifunctional non-homologous end joining protein LigD